MLLFGWSRCLALESLGYPDLDDRLRLMSAKQPASAAKDHGVHGVHGVRVLDTVLCGAPLTALDAVLQPGLDERPIGLVRLRPECWQRMLLQRFQQASFA